MSGQLWPGQTLFPQSFLPLFHIVSVHHKAEDLQKASYPQGLGILKAVYGNAKDFRFVFTGNIDIEAFKPLMCKYIASLPSEDETKPGKAKDFGIMPVKGNRELTYRKQMENPKTTVNIVATGKIPYNLKNIVAINALDHILDIVYFENNIIGA